MCPDSSHKTAITAGFDYLDCVEIYYGSDKLISITIKESGVSRSKLFITNKYKAIAGTPSLDETENVIDKSLASMQTRYFNLCVTLACQSDDR